MTTQTQRLRRLAVGVVATLSIVGLGAGASTAASVSAKDWVGHANSTTVSAKDWVGHR
ncbi:MAG: hypothetical protein ACR2KJ_01380 [Jatrophihabitans sp.]